MLARAAEGCRIWRGPPPAGQWSIAGGWVGGFAVRVRVFLREGEEEGERGGGRRRERRCFFENEMGTDLKTHHVHDV